MGETYESYLYGGIGETGILEADYASECFLSVSCVGLCQNREKGFCRTRPNPGVVKGFEVRSRCEGPLGYIGEEFWVVT